MRRFIRHPSDIPISYSLGSTVDYSPRLKDVGVGGLCFLSESKLPIGTEIDVSIPLETFSYEATGVVVWSCPESEMYSVGVEFCDIETRYTMRMVEQVCHIEHYRSEVLEQEGRVIDSEQAAKEWVDKYAAEFPTA